MSRRTQVWKISVGIRYAGRVEGKGDLMGVGNNIANSIDANECRTPRFASWVVIARSEPNCAIRRLHITGILTSGGGNCMEAAYHAFSIAAEIARC